MFINFYNRYGFSLIISSLYKRNIWEAASVIEKHHKFILLKIVDSTYSRKKHHLFKMPALWFKHLNKRYIHNWVKFVPMNFLKINGGQ